MNPNEIIKEASWFAYLLSTPAGALSVAVVWKALVDFYEGDPLPANTGKRVSRRDFLENLGASGAALGLMWLGVGRIEEGGGCSTVTPATKRPEPTRAIPSQTPFSTATETTPPTEAPLATKPPPTEVPTINPIEICEILPFSELNNQAGQNWRVSWPPSSEAQAAMLQSLATDSDPNGEATLSQITTWADRLKADSGKLQVTEVDISTAGGGWAMKVVDPQIGNFPVWTVKADTGMLSSRPDGAENDHPVTGGYQVPNFNSDLLEPKIHIQAVSNSGQTFGCPMMVLTDKSTGKIVGKLNTINWNWVMDPEYIPTPSPTPKPDASLVSKNLGIETTQTSPTEGKLLGTLVFIGADGYETPNEESAIYVARKYEGVFPYRDAYSVYGEVAAIKSDAGWVRTPDDDIETKYRHLATKNEDLYTGRGKRNTLWYMQGPEYQSKVDVFDFQAHPTGEVWYETFYSEEFQRDLIAVYGKAVFYDSSNKLTLLSLRIGILDPSREQFVLMSKSCDDGSPLCGESIKVNASFEEYLSFFAPAYNKWYISLTTQRNDPKPPLREVMGMSNIQDIFDWYDSQKPENKVELNRIADALWQRRQLFVDPNKIIPALAVRVVIDP